MLDKFLPERIDNAYCGHKLALWLFALVVALRITQSVSIVFNGYSVAKSADGIPLDTYAPAAARTVVALFTLSALSRLIIALLCVLVLVRYRSAIPFMFVVLILSYLGSQLILWLLPIDSTGTPPGPFVNLVAFAVMIVGLALSLWRRGTRST